MIELTEEDKRVAASNAILDAIQFPLPEPQIQHPKAKDYYPLGHAGYDAAKMAYRLVPREIIDALPEWTERVCNAWMFNGIEPEGEEGVHKIVYGYHRTGEVHFKGKEPDGIKNLMQIANLMRSCNVAHEQKELTVRLALHKWVDVVFHRKPEKPNANRV